jgi:hypothetical protein
MATASKSLISMPLINILSLFGGYGHLEIRGFEVVSLKLSKLPLEIEYKAFYKCVC